MSAALVFLTVWYIIRASGEFSGALIILFEMENRMIITVTLNPAIDKTVTVEKLGNEYDYIEVTNWRECKEIIDTIEDSHIEK